MSVPALIGDIGGTNCRLALYRPGEGIAGRWRARRADFPGLEAAIAHYLRALPAAERPRRAALAVAAPIAGDEVLMTNTGWTFSVRGMRAALDLDELRVLNDFAALALALPVLAPADRLAIGPERVPGPGPLAVLGPGTGLGTALSVPAAGHWVAVPGEGGHVSLAALNRREAAVIERLRLRFDHVSAERLLSGPGLLLLYRTLAEVSRRGPRAEDPEQVSRGALDGSDELAADALDMFFKMLGSTAGNLALSAGARGGVYLAGGILPPLREALQRSGFRERFIAKGRFREYLDPLPTWLITHPHPAELGLAALLDGLGEVSP
ncbi:glucokinase [Alkalilimnicola sp. S0819]|uniref:glucokinase n=1 Tax=Alkalilimnicola sp. S0819 TaxID=2613922 RepID=UPI0012625049|nr:glucokinase [Alkalilimnicola sp. S0819]KAB7628185.1 glucokinase [Alkalilimnicola sp. S0819]MPQ15074.1 glucokinase [Alkalilimnicola sp. S0819]